MRVLLTLVLCLHVSLSGFAFFTEGYFGAFPPFNEIWTTQIFSDLVISLGLLWFFLFREAKKKGRPLWRIYTCGIGIIFLGSISPLVYLLTVKDVFTRD